MVVNSVKWDAELQQSRIGVDLVEIPDHEFQIPFSAMQGATNSQMLCVFIRMYGACAYGRCVLHACYALNTKASPWEIPLIICSGSHTPARARTRVLRIEPENETIFGRPLKHGWLFDTLATVQHPEEGDSRERWPHHLRPDSLAEKCQDKLPRL